MIKTGCCTSPLNRFMPLPEAVNLIAELGFKSVEINACDHSCFPSGMSESSMARLLTGIEKNSLELNIHIDLNYICRQAYFAKKPFYEFAVGLIEPFFQWSKYVKLRMITFDALYTKPAAGNTGFNDILYYKAAKAKRTAYGYLANNLKLLSSLDPIKRLFNRKLVFYRHQTAGIINYVSASLKDTDIKTGIENFNTGTCTSEDFTILRDEVRGSLGLLLDIGHANLNIKNCIAGSKSFYEYIVSLPIPVIDVHASDNDGSYDQHLPLGSGKIDYKEVIAALENIKYEGNIMLEIEDKNEKSLVKSLLGSKKTLEGALL